MALHQCAVEVCTNKALVGPLDVYTACGVCGLRFCGSHFDNPFQHKCATKSKERRDNYQWLQRLKLGLAAKERIDISAFLAEAMALRPGHTCTGPAKLVRDMDQYMTPEEDVTIFEGSYHWNFLITFDDGVKWVVRMAQIDHALPPLAALRMTAASECATLKTLSDAGIKVPRAWPSRGLTPEHDGLPYFYTEFIEGGFVESFLRRDARINPPPSDHCIRALAEMYIGISGLPFDSVGSLHTDAEGSIRIGPVVAPTTMLPQHPWFLGPFPTARAFYLAHIDLVLDQIIEGVCYPAFLAVDGYMIYKVLRNLITTCEDLGVGPWYIRAVDDKGDRYLFTDGSLAGVIDWEWAFLTCKGEAFAAPSCLLHPDYYLGNNELSTWELSLASAYADLGRSDLAECVKNGKKFQRLRDLLETDNHDVTQLHALYRAFLGSDEHTDLPQPESVLEWYQLAARDFPDLGLYDGHLAVLHYRAALASYLPGTRLPPDSDSENEESDAESDWDSISLHSKASASMERADTPISVSNPPELEEDCPNSRNVEHTLSLCH